MPIHSCKLPDGSDGYKWGDHGTCYKDRKDAEKQAEAAYANGYAGDAMINIDISHGLPIPGANSSHTFLAFDKSVRHKSPDGVLHVDVSNISKAMVCPYLGKEIPDYKSLGLQPDRIYQLLRDPEELKKGAPTFRNLPLLIKHVPVSADDPRKDLVVGSTGSDIEFKDPYLSGSLSIWDAAAIAGIESKDQTELSSAYRYIPIMKSGTYQGVPYDGVMTQIIGNHVALVDVGRAGPDVVVADQNPFFNRENHTMKKQDRLEAAKLEARKALDGLLAQDADLSELDKVLAGLLAQDKKKMAKDEEEEEKDDEEEKRKKKEKEEAERKKVAEDEDEEDEEEKEDDRVSKGAMDAAIKAATQATEKKVKADMEALYTARKEVAQMVGEVALDSAEAVYKFALDHAGIDTEGVHPSAYRAMIKLVGAEKQKPAHVAMDGKAVKDITERFPHLKRIG